MRWMPGKTIEFAVGERIVERDEEGFLFEPNDWGKDVAEAFAAEELLTLVDDHWMVLDFMRDYFNEHAVAADARFVFSYIAKEKNLPKKEAREYFFELFPYGYVQQACRIAGMKQPRAWSTG